MQSSPFQIKLHCSNVRYQSLFRSRWVFLHLWNKLPPSGFRGRSRSLDSRVISVESLWVAAESYRTNRIQMLEYWVIKTITAKNHPLWTRSESPPAPRMLNRGWLVSIYIICEMIEDYQALQIYHIIYTELAASIKSMVMIAPSQGFIHSRAAGTCSWRTKVAASRRLVLYVMKYQAYYGFLDKQAVAVLHTAKVICLPRWFFKSSFSNKIDSMRIIRSG